MEETYRVSMAEFAEALNELMADLEDLRDDAQDCLDDTGEEAVREDVRRMDDALRLLSRAADLLEGEEDHE